MDFLYGGGGGGGGGKMGLGGKEQLGFTLDKIIGGGGWVGQFLCLEH